MKRVIILPAALSGTEDAPCWHIAPKETTAASIGCRSHSVSSYKNEYNIFTIRPPIKGAPTQAMLICFIFVYF